MEYFRSEVMEMCHDARLYQIDLLNGSRNRVTEREYWAKKKGQLALDEENAVLAEQGLPVKAKRSLKPTKTSSVKKSTQHSPMRSALRSSLKSSFAVVITVKESRGRLSYLTPDRTRPVTARKLGDDFDKAAVFAVFVRNAKRVRAKTPLVHSAHTIQDRIRQQNAIGHMVDMEVAKEKGGVMRIGQRPTISKI